MKIGYLIPEFPGQTHIFFWREIQALRKMEAEICIISTKRPDSRLCRHDFAKSAIQETYYLFPSYYIFAIAALMIRPIKIFKAFVYILQLKESSFKERLMCIGFILCAANLLNYSKKQKIKHIHVHSCANSAHIVALCNILGGPSYSLTLHGDLIVYGKDHISKMKYAAFVATVAKYLQKQIIEKIGLHYKQVPIIMMGVDVDKFTNVNKRIYKKDLLNLITNARLNNAKGHKYALRAVRIALNEGIHINYIITGEGPHRAEIESEIQQLDLNNFVKMLGTVSEDMVIELLQKAGAYILSSIGMGEASPVCIMEAMSCELPVICSKIGGTQDMIIHNVDGVLVDQKDVIGIADALVDLAQDVEKRQRIGKAARKKAIECFDSKIGAYKLLEAIKNKT